MKTYSTHSSLRELQPQEVELVAGGISTWVDHNNNGVLDDGDSFVVVAQDGGGGSSLSDFGSAAGFTGSYDYGAFNRPQWLEDFLDSINDSWGVTEQEQIEQAAALREQQETDFQNRMVAEAPNAQRYFVQDANGNDIVAYYANGQLWVDSDRSGKVDQMYYSVGDGRIGAQFSWDPFNYHIVANPLNVPFPTH